MSWISNAIHHPGHALAEQLSPILAFRKGGSIGSTRIGNLDNIINSENATLNYGANQIHHDPTNLLRVDPASAAVWNLILGTNKPALTNAFGSPSNSTWQGAQKANPDINFTRDHVFRGIGDVVAGIYGGGALNSAFSGTSAGSGATGATAGDGAAGAANAGDVVGTSGDMLASSTGAGIDGGLLADAAPAAGQISTAASDADLAAQVAAPVALDTTAPTLNVASSSSGLSNAAKTMQQGQGLLQQSQPQQQPMQAAQQAPDPQKQQRARMLLLQENQLQSLRMKPNKTMEDYMQLAQANRNQGLLGQ